MKALKTIALVAALGGCATTPQQTIEETEPYRLKSTLPPDRAAHCIIRSAESKIASFTGREEDPPAPGARKIVIRHPDAGTSVVAHVMPDGGGSDITLWLSWQHMFFRDTLVAIITKGC
jgi:hypothetical protein